jgi:ABC-2 type transport system permease protein
MVVFERIRHMIRKEFIQVFRDPRMKPMIFVTPIIQLMLFGYAVTTDVRHIVTAVYDLDNSVASRELVSRFQSSGYFDVVEYVESEERARELIDRSSAQAVLQMNHGFGERLQRGQPAELQMLLDGTDSNTAGIVLQYSTRIVSAFSRNLLLSLLSRSIGVSQAPVSVDLQTRAWFNDNLESRNFFVPGVVVLIVTLITLMLTSMAVVREKEIGTMEQIMVTPISPVELILGKTIPFAAIAYFDVVIVTLVAVFWFNVPIRGSIVLLVFSTALYLLTMLGLGLLISTISQTQQQAMMTVFFFFMPAILLSGLMFPIANMPVVIQGLTYINPLRYFLVIIRGIFLKGVGLDILWPQMTVLAAMGIFTLGLASRRFKKTMV